MDRPLLHWYSSRSHSARLDTARIGRRLSVSLPNEIGEPAGTPANPQVAAVQWLTVVVVVPLLALYVFSTLTGG